MLVNLEDVPLRPALGGRRWPSFGIRETVNFTGEPRPAELPKARPLPPAAETWALAERNMTGTAGQKRATHTIAPAKMTKTATHHSMACTFSRNGTGERGCRNEKATRDTANVRRVRHYLREHSDLRQHSGIDHAHWVLTQAQAAKVIRLAYLNRDCTRRCRD
jgi:hypothetical protein